MKESEIANISSLIRLKIGAHVRGAKDSSGARAALSFWFENYNRSDGPIFSIRPSGLKRHVISLAFGVYAAPCIEHIKDNATPEAYLLAYAFVNQLDKAFEVKLNDNPPEESWKIEDGFNLVVTRKISNQKDSVSILESVNSVMLPIMAAIAELIGYEELDGPDHTGEVEGELTQTLTKKRERSPRNRLLCLSIHGDFCGVCGYDPKSLYGSEAGSILEVHHIEPLAKITNPKAYDPATDLIPLCPNCHRAIHRRNPAYTPNELKELLLL